MNKENRIRLKRISRVLSLRLFLLSACFFFLTVCSAATRRVELSPPRAKVVPEITNLHGDTLTDNYFWLRDKSNPEVIAYLESENEYADKMMKHTEALQSKLYQEMVGRIKETDVTVPERIDDYYYYRRTEKGKQYPLYCRRKGSMEAPEEVLLDQNSLAQGNSYCEIGVYQISPNHRYLAYSLDYDGSEVYTLYVKDLLEARLLNEQVPNTSYSVEWANDNQTLFYNVQDSAKRPYRIYRHNLGTAPSQDVLIFEETDARFYASVSKTRSEQYLLLSTASNTTSEVRYLSADLPRGEFQLIHPRRHLMEYSVDHHSNSFYILTNDQTKRFRLMKTGVDNPSRANWSELIPERPGITLLDVDLFEDHLVIYERDNGLKKARIENLSTGAAHYVDFPEESYTFYPTGNHEFRSNLIRFEYESMVTPPSLYDYNMETRERHLLKKEEVAGYDPIKYRTERTFATAEDGTKVPISLVFTNGITRNGKAPTQLYGYGAYGSAYEIFFSSERLSLLDRGVIFAVAHIRGGGYHGREWYEQGKLLNKKNTFTDFIACAEHLIREKYTSSDRLVISGGSAGGLLMGAVTNMRPDLFRAVIARVPFVDVIHTMLDRSIPLVVIEFEEWGNPAEEKFYHYMRSYSPYDNVETKIYPAMLITSSLNDPRVPFWEPAKWLAQLRSKKTDNNLLMLKTNMGAGHSGSSGRYDHLKEIAFHYAFLLDQLGIKN